MLAAKASLAVDGLDGLDAAVQGANPCWFIMWDALRGGGPTVAATDCCRKCGDQRVFEPGRRRPCVVAGGTHDVHDLETPTRPGS